VRADEKLTAFIELETGDSGVIFSNSADSTQLGAEKALLPLVSGGTKARQIVAVMVKASLVTSSDVSTHLRHG